MTIPSNQYEFKNSFNLVNSSFYSRVSLGLKKGQGAESKKRTLDIFKGTFLNS